MIEIRRTEFRWRAAPLTQAIATCAGVALTAALIAPRWQLVAFVAPLLGVLCSIGWQRPGATVQVHAQPASQRCFESERIRVSVWATAESDGVAVDLTVAAIAPMELEVLDTTSDSAQTVAVTARRWGRYPIRARVDVIAHGGLLAGTATVDAAEVAVFPIATPQSTPIPRTELLDRLGTHLTRHTGPGVEYADVRAYVPGDQLRTVNWPVSARRGRLHVTQRLTDRAADVVVLVDMSTQAPGPATEATERIARGAAQMVQSALRAGDRAGIVVLGDRRPRWLGADIGRRQFYRVLDAVLGVGSGFETMTGTLAPRVAVPAGAIIVGFSTLLDTDFGLALVDLRERGHVVLAVDVLEGSPLEGEQDPLVNRMWALHRSAMYRDMATVGVDVVCWRTDNTLDQSMRLARDRRRPVRGSR